MQSSSYTTNCSNNIPNFWYITNVNWSLKGFWRSGVYAAELKLFKNCVIDRKLFVSINNVVESFHLRRPPRDSIGTNSTNLHKFYSQLGLKLRRIINQHSNIRTHIRIFGYLNIRTYSNMHFFVKLITTKILYLKKIKHFYFMEISS